MTLALVTVCISMIVGGILFVLWPQISTPNSVGRPPSFFWSLKDLHSERLRSLANLQDLELDRSMGKISESDYAQLQNSLMTDLSRLYQEIQKIEDSESVLKKIERDASESVGVGS